MILNKKSWLNPETGEGMEERLNMKKKSFSGLRRRRGRKNGISNDEEVMKDGKYFLDIVRGHEERMKIMCDELESMLNHRKWQQVTSPARRFSV